VAIQIPVGSEQWFRGVIDLIEERALLYESEDAHVPTEGPVPEELIEEFRNHREQMVEKIAETDDDLIIKLLDDQEITKEEIKSALRRATIDYRLVPVVCGSALRNRGVQPLLDAIGDYLPSPVDVPPVRGKDCKTGEEVVREARTDAPFAALAFKAVIDPFIGRLVYIRVYSGKASSGDTIFNSATGKRERLGRIVQMHAQRREEIDEVGVGDIAAVVGARDASTGDTLCDQNAPVVLETIVFPQPVMSIAIEPKTRADQDKLTDVLHKLADEDPTLNVQYDEETGQTVMSGMGELHLEILMDRMKREFKVETNTGRPRVSYREAITVPTRAEGRFVRQTGGHGQFGHVWLRVEPLKDRSGFEFVDDIKGGAIPREFIPAVRKGVEDALGVGPLAGYPVLGVRVVLQDGSFHEVDSSEMAFRIAGSMAAKSAMRRAKPVLLEPIMRIEVVTPGEFLGDILGDLSRRRAGIRNIEGQGGIQVITAGIPLGESFGYANTLRSLSQGRASHSMEFEKYDEAPPSVVATTHTAVSA
jgi:elongation factor G